MKPPICAICGIKFDPINSGGLVYFKMRQSDIEWHERMKKIKGTGHPPESAWFCDKHYPLANDLSHLTIDLALQQIKQTLHEN
jgi:hypothetical protein